MKLALAVFVVLLAGCSMPGTTLRHAPPNPDITGIESVLSAGARADVVIIHGMYAFYRAHIAHPNSGRGPDGLGSLAEPSRARAAGPFLFVR